MQLTLTIDLAGAAFGSDEEGAWVLQPGDDDYGMHEVSRILAKVAHEIGTRGYEVGEAEPLRDVNGQKVGRVIVTR